MLKKIAVTICESARLLGHPAHWRSIQRDARRSLTPPRSDAEHLEAALSWLCRAQDATGSGGVSAGYFFRRGWMPPYPETTGYLIPTFLRQAGPYLERAVRMGDWEIQVQLPCGGVRGGIGLNPYPIVFNTGQVVLGWMALYRTLGESRYLEAARRACDWLLSIQDQDGKWVRHTYLNAPRAYHARVAWPLLEVHQATADPRYREAAERFFSWLLLQRRARGFFAHMALEPGRWPLTHTIAYTLRGLLEAALLLGNGWRETLLDAVSLSSEHILSAQSACFQPGPARLPATLDETWSSPDRHSCLTGNAQLAIVWLRLHALRPCPPLARAALCLIDQLKAHQDLAHPHPGIRGGLAGSFPLWGAYVPFALPNWAAKFLADALWVKLTSAIAPPII